MLSPSTFRAMAAGLAALTLTCGAALAQHSEERGGGRPAARPSIGGGQSRVVAPQQRFVAPQQRVAPPQQRFIAPQQRFAAPPQRFVAPQQRFVGPAAPMARQVRPFGPSLVRPGFVGPSRSVRVGGGFAPRFLGNAHRRFWHGRWLWLGAPIAGIALDPCWARVYTDWGWGWYYTCAYDPDVDYAPY